MARANDGGKKPKRGHGDGTIYFDEKKQFWVGQVMLGYKLDGKPNRRTVYAKTRREVVEKLDALKSDYRGGTLTAPTRITVGEYLVGDIDAFIKSEGAIVGGWLATHKQFGGRNGKGLRPNTYSCYAGIIKNHVLPEIGRVQLQRLTVDNLERLYAAILEKKLPDGSNMSMRQAHLAHQVLNIALGAAYRKGILKINPCERVPKKPHTSYRAEDRPRLSRSDIPRVLAEVKGSRYYMRYVASFASW